MSDWISVDDRLPEENGVYETTVVVGSINPEEIVFPTRFHDGKFSKSDWRYVTHWRPPS